jgi:hypothetical protein
MSDRQTVAWRIARLLAGHAARNLPAGRREWSRAMLNEIEHLPDAGTAIHWGAGCIVTGYIDRIHTMNRSLKHVSPLIFSLEMLLCFVPITWLFLAVLSSSVRGAWPAADALLYLSATLSGPVGLIIALRTALLGREAGRLGIASCVLAAWSFTAYSGLIVRNEGGLSSDGWRSFVLIGLLPALATAHLIYIAHGKKSRSAIAGA